LIVFLEIKEIKRQDNVELLQEVGPKGMVGLHFQRRFSANYFHTAFLVLADPAMGGGFNSLATFSRGPRGRHEHFSANFRKSFFWTTAQATRTRQSWAGLRSKNAA
jgi:hypothetical protein